MSLQYPLLFPYGERGFQLGNVGVLDRKRNTVTIHDFLSAIYIIDPINLTHTFVTDNYQNKLW
jgi:hypothetical protein